MRIVRERKQQCPAFANVVVREDEADTRLPSHGIPDHVACCAQEVDGSENAPARLTGPASRAPDVGKEEGAGDESDAGDDSDDASEDPEASEARARATRPRSPSRMSRRLPSPWIPRRT